MTQAATPQEAAELIARAFGGALPAHPDHNPAEWARGDSTRQSPAAAWRAEQGGTNDHEAE